MTAAWLFCKDQVPGEISLPFGSSGHAAELWTPEFCHPVESTDTNLCFCRLIVEVLCLEFRSDDGFPPAHPGLDPAALVVAGEFLPGRPGRPAPGLDFGDVAVAYRWIVRRLPALNCRLGRWNNDLHDLAKACFRQIAGRRSIIGTISGKPGNWTVNPIEKIRQGRWIANIIGGQPGTDDLSADKIES